jgi:hypothetical protein
MPRGPAGTRHGAAGFLERQEEFVAQKGLSCGARQGIPTIRIYLRDAGQYTHAHGELLITRERRAV